MKHEKGVSPLNNRESGKQIIVIHIKCLLLQQYHSIFMDSVISKLGVSDIYSNTVK